MSHPKKESGLTPDEEKNLQRYFENAYVGDESRELSDESAFKWYDPLIVVYSVASYIVDTGLDIAVAVSLYNQNQMWYFGLTIAFVIIPTLTMTLFSLRWYIADSKIEGSPKPSPLVWTIRIILLLLQLGPALRYLDMLRYGLMFKKSKDPEEKKKYYRWMIYEDEDAALLRLFEAFMEAAPQLVLQIYILSKPDNQQDSFTVMIQVGSCAVSLMSISWALASQQRAMRISLSKEKTPSWPASIVQTLWYLFVTCSRMLTLGLFASMFPVTLAVVCGIRWIIMTLWLQTMHSEFSSSKAENILFKCVLGVVFLFCYFNPESSPTRWRYFFYYLYTFTENCILIGFWYTTVDPELWYRLPCIYAVFLTFFIGIILMVIYYLLLHPSGKIEVNSWRCAWYEPEDEVIEKQIQPEESPLFYTSKNNVNLSYNNQTDVASHRSSGTLDSEFDIETDQPPSLQTTLQADSDSYKVNGFRNKIETHL